MSTSAVCHSDAPRRAPITGWIGVTAIALVYAALYIANLWLPPAGTNHMTRIWDWSQLTLTATAAIVLMPKWRRVTTGVALSGLALALLSALAHMQRDPSPLWSALEGAAVWLCFLAGVALFKEVGTPALSAFRPPLAAIGRGVTFGALIAIPLAVVNNLYFYLTAGPSILQDSFASAIEALSPAIHEEIVFRFFVMALCFRLLRSSPSRRWVMAVAVFLAVVPHSLNHLPDLFLINPLMGVVMLLATSLLFGWPMALLQLRRNLEAAIAFHWLIDFARFLCGF